MTTLWQTGSYVAVVMWRVSAAYLQRPLRWLSRYVSLRKIIENCADRAAHAGNGKLRGVIDSIEMMAVINPSRLWCCNRSNI